ncbi:N-acetylglucosamine kinase [Amycolatopsis cihanbeyliensis]|uniref:N-acetylglucosamine kinase-like BadF-type ATPase n=1 Tax=Amycolatopsis cihanbeyliensis TaxID=1128664 RepID=A0A542DIT0_AMYCI|nr:BadF/BadG/BcrA/BcrD ATPase family protein [Amycolatopsis cihanbeyliensis]TQJ02980.1 N-acetylglucosamine kinase-like BadF-type ATPase [Amycolatopsis cihanbeyliensis]
MTGTEPGHVVGVDTGGTSTRALAVDAGGQVLGRGQSGGGNPNSHPPEQAAAHLAEAIGSALADVHPAHTMACTIGMAGTSKVLSDPDVAAVFQRTWEGLGLGCRVHLVTDAEAAYAAATSRPDGTVLIAGTGSIAGRIRTRSLATTVGGYGWLLGDEGSAFWIGREAVRFTLDALGRGEPLDGLAAAVLAEAIGLSGVDRLTDGKRADAWRGLITAANAEPPVRLARFAPLVSAADEAGQPGAGEITERAADHLVASALEAREPGEDTPVVLVGSVLGEQSPVGAKVRRRLAGCEVLTSPDGVLGAAWLAAVDAFGEGAARPRY